MQQHAWGKFRHSKHPAAPPTRGLYSLAWTKLLAAESFPEHFLPGLGGLEDQTQSASPTPPTSNPPQKSDGASFATVADIVDAWRAPSALDERDLAYNRAFAHFFLPSPSVAALVEAPPADRDDAPKLAVKRTFQPSLIRRKRKHGFLARNRSRAGRKIMNRRKAKGRWRICA